MQKEAASFWDGVCVIQLRESHHISSHPVPTGLESQQVQKNSVWHQWSGILIALILGINYLGN